MGLQRDIPDQSPPLTPVGFNECLTQVVWALQGPLYGGEQNREVPSPEAFGSVCVVHNTMINERASQPMWGFLTLNSGRADNHPSGTDTNIVLPVTKSEMPMFIYCMQNRHSMENHLAATKGQSWKQKLVWMAFAVHVEYPSFQRHCNTSRPVLPCSHSYCVHVSDVISSSSCLYQISDPSLDAFLWKYPNTP